VNLRAKTRIVSFFAGAFVTLAACAPASALTIQATFDSSIVNAPNAADIENTINFATNEISSLFSNPGTVTILFKYSPGSFLGESNSSFYFDTYATVTSELQANLSANPQNAVLATALNNLSNGNDANGARDIETTSAEFRLALGDNTATPCFDASGTFVSGCNSVFDGVITLSSSQPIDFTRPVPAYDGTNLEYDGVRVAEHEIDEVLGGGGSGSMLGSPDQSTRYGVLDLYRYSAPGTPSYTGSGLATSYFSIDGGNTDIVGFNQSHTGDYADWGPNITLCDAGGTGGPGFVQDAFSCNNVQADVTTSSPEYAMLQAIGYDPANAAPQNIVWDCSTNPDSANHPGSIGATKTTGCTQVVLGTNTYTGVTLVEAGTLQLGNGGTTGSVTSNIIDNAVLVFDRSDSYAYAGVISGTGNVTQSGGGYLFLTGNSNYSGGTAVASGSALVLGLNGTTGSVTGNVTDNGLFYVYRSNVYEFDGAISGSGVFVQSGSGTTILTAANSYTGGTAIQAGTLQLGNGGTSGSITGNVNDGGTLAFDRSDTVVFAGAISGSGGVLQEGSGTTILTGANSYTGDTTIQTGTLQLGDGGASGSIAGNVTDNGALVFDRSDSIQFGGSIAGSGSLMQAGSGYVFLVGTNSPAGGTTVASGALVLGLNGTSGSLTGNVVDNGLFYIYRADKYEFDGTISGSGKFLQSGSGTAILTATNTNTGGTVVQAGTLQLGNGGVSGSVAGNVIDNGVLAFDRSDNFAFAGVVSGTGALVQEGSGYLYLTGASTYSGGTTIANGALVLGNNGTTGSITGNVVDNGLLYVLHTDQYVFAGIISGSGRFVQSGTGRTILTANNSYSGKTIVQAGTLQVGNGGTTGAIAGDVSDNGALVFDRSDSVAYAGAIAGTGSVTQTGSGFLFLTGSSSYTGGTTVTAGSLVLGLNGTSGSITGNVTDNSILYFYRSDHVSFGGTISGTGEVVQSGSGSTALTTSNGYSGGTVVQAGTLEAAVSTAIGPGNLVLNGPSATLLLDNNVNLANTVGIDQAAFIDVNGSDSATLSGALVGSAPFEKDGTGTLTLNHDNRPTYSGNISFHGTLVAGVTGAFGTGTVTDLGSNLVLMDGVTYTNPTNLVDDLNIAQNSGVSTITGVISQTGGPWGIQKSGSGTLVVASSNSFTGPTTVSAGALVLTGSIAGGAVVESGAMLAIAGTIGGGLDVQNGATVSSTGLGTLVGAPAGVSALTAGGAIVLASGSSTQIGVAPSSSSDRLVSATSIALGGTLTLAPVGTFQPRFGDSFLVASAPVITGTFNAVPDTLSGVLFPTARIVTVGASQEVIVSVDAASYLSEITSPSVDQAKIATTLDAARAPHYTDLKPLYDALDPLSSATFATALSDLVPNIQRTLPLIGEIQAQGFSSILSGHLGDLQSASDGQQEAAFVVNAHSLMLAENRMGPGATRFLSTAFSPGAPQFNAAYDTDSGAPAAFLLGGNAGGFLTASSLDGSVASVGAGKGRVSGFVIAGGVESHVTDKLVLGASLAYADASTSLLATPSSAQVDSILGAAYGRYSDDGWFVSGFAGDSSQSISTARQVVAGATVFHLHGHTNGDSPTVAVEAGHEFSLAQFRVSPVAGLQWLETSTNGYTETGGAPAMTFADVSRDSLLGRLGIDVDGAIDLGGATVRPIAHAYYVHDFESGARQVTAAFAGAPSALLSFGLASKSRDWGDVGAGFEVDASPGVTLGARYDATVGRSDLFYGAWTGHLDIRF
jgi:autotransporter-associated beta strand protein